MRERWSTLLWLLAVAMLLAAAVLVATMLLVGMPQELALVALALVLAAVACWRGGVAMRKLMRDSAAWTEAAAVRSLLDRRETLWSALPAPAAAWDADGQLLFATAAWRRLGASVETPPTQPELSIGSPQRLFVVEAEEQSGTRVVFLREVTRERQALQAKDELLALLGHELRTPLSSIKGYGQLMARQLATVQEQVQRLDALIADVLDSAHTEAGPLPLRREPLSVSDLVRSACERFVAAQPGRTVQTSVVATAVIEGDADRLSQVLDNILSNAAKYSPPDAPIEVRTYIDPGVAEHVRIAITDQGAGIAAEHLPRLFDRFYRVPADGAPSPAGFGLGLSIVRDLVEAHGGRVEVYSAGRGKGSTFTVVLPVALPLADAAAESPTTLASA